jgi:hypothetical protein
MQDGNFDGKETRKHFDALQPGQPRLHSSTQWSISTLEDSDAYIVSRLPAHLDEVFRETTLSFMSKGRTYPDFGLSDSIIGEDGCIEMDVSAISTKPGGDFNGTLTAQYWTPQPETAERYQ